MPYKKIKQVCPVCRKEFVGNKTRKFCSIVCVGQYHSIRPRFKKEPTCDELKELYFKKNKSLAWLIRYFKISRSSMKRRLKRCNLQSKFPIPPHFINAKRMPTVKKLRIKASGGYIKILAPNNFRADKRGYVQEHIVVWENYHKKALPKGWIVHHLNGIKNDNRPENLLAIPQRQHSSWLVMKAQAERIKELEQQIKGK